MTFSSVLYVVDEWLSAGEVTQASALACSAMSNVPVQVVDAADAHSNWHMHVLH